MVEFCQFEKREYTEKKNPTYENVIERTYFYRCLIDENGMNCPHPAIYCRFKHQLEEIARLIQTGELTRKQIINMYTDGEVLPG